MDNAADRVQFYHLHKQSLLRREESDAYSRILDRHIALHSTDYTTPYLSLWARVNDFEPRWLLDDLNQKRAVRLRAFRGTVFVVHTDNVLNILKASEIFLPDRLKDAVRQSDRSGLDLKTVERRIRSMLSGGNTLPTRSIRVDLNMSLDDTQFLIARRYLEFKAVLARAGQRYITDPVITYSLMEDWLPDIDLNSATAEKALDDLMLRYISLFGPVTADDIAWWFPLSKTKVRDALGRIEDHVIRFGLFEKVHLMDAGDYERFLAFDPPSDKPVITFLPYEDHFPKAYKHRDWYVAPPIPSPCSSTPARSTGGSSGLPSG